MEGFKYFVENSDNDAKQTLKKLPKSHAALIKGYKFKWENGPCLKNDKDHVGVIDPKKKTITISSPWLHSRQFTTLHELAHQVWTKYVLGTPLEKKWKTIVKNTKDKKKEENAEELFCHSYASYYSDYPVAIHDHVAWRNFIKNLPK